MSARPAGRPACRRRRPPGIRSGWCAAASARRPRRRRVGVERRVLRHHRGAHRHAARHRADGDEMRLRGRREIDEDRDEDQHDVREQPDEAEREGEALADGGGDLGGARIAHARGEQRAQHAAAVHRERRDQVEQHEEDVDHRQPVDHRDLGAVDRGQAPRSSLAPKNTTSTSAITTFTSGPAMAMTNSSRGSSEMRSSRASPPIGSSVTSGVAIP